MLEFFGGVLVVCLAVVIPLIITTIFTPQRLNKQINENACELTFPLTSREKIAIGTPCELVNGKVSPIAICSSKTVQNIGFRDSRLLLHATLDFDPAFVFVDRRSRVVFESFVIHHNTLVQQGPTSVLPFNAQDFIGLHVIAHLKWVVFWAGGFAILTRRESGDLTLTKYPLEAVHSGCPILQQGCAVKTRDGKIFLWKGALTELHCACKTGLLVQSTAFGQLLLQDGEKWFVLDATTEQVVFDCVSSTCALVAPDVVAYYDTNKNRLLQYNFKEDFVLKEGPCLGAPALAAHHSALRAQHEELCSLTLNQQEIFFPMPQRAIATGIGNDGTFLLLVQVEHELVLQRLGDWERFVLSPGAVFLGVSSKVFSPGDTTITVVTNGVLKHAGSAYEQWENLSQDGRNLFFNFRSRQDARNVRAVASSTRTLVVQ